MLAGDVYKPSMWHSIVRRAGFSNMPESEFKGLPGTYTSSREVLAASKLKRASDPR